MWKPMSSYSHLTGRSRGNGGSQAPSLTTRKILKSRPRAPDLCCPDLRLQTWIRISLVVLDQAVALQFLHSRFEISTKTDGATQASSLASAIALRSVNERLMYFRMTRYPSLSQRTSTTLLQVLVAKLRHHHYPHSVRTSRSITLSNTTTKKTCFLHFSSRPLAIYTATRCPVCTIMLIPMALVKISRASSMPLSFSVRTVLFRHNFRMPTTTTSVRSRHLHLQPQAERLSHDCHLQRYFSMMLGHL